MPRHTRSFQRRAVLLGGVAALSSTAGCADRLTGPSDDGDVADNEGETAEPRISENEQGTGGIPLIRLAAREDGWYGMGPEGFSDEKNPTLHLQDGTDYEIIWQNLDGERHNLAIADSNGNELASTEPVESDGELQSLVITATDSMTNYLCPFHSNEEQGEIEFI